MVHKHDYHNCGCGKCDSCQANIGYCLRCGCDDIEGPSIPCVPGASVKVEDYFAMQERYLLREETEPTEVTIDWRNVVEFCEGCGETATVRDDGHPRCDDCNEDW